MLHDKKITRHMSAVEEYRERLTRLQGAWDTLSLLSHLSGDGSDLSGTRQAFETLAAELIQNLSGETLKKAHATLTAKAQISIDILVRNLFERTADVGFLSADADLCTYLRELQAARHSGEAQSLQVRAAGMVQRLREYVAKYSVYSDIVVLAPDGEVLLSLHPQDSLTHSRDPLIKATLDTSAAYVETYRKIDFQASPRSLVYSCRIVDQGTVRGVLCLCFDLADEVRRIFAKLGAADDWTIFAYVDPAGTVLASSDPLQLPIDARVPLALEPERSVARFAGREYLAVTRRTNGYQGYMGPGWLAHAFVPIEYAFEQSSDAQGLEPALLNELSDSELIFSAELRRIPNQARQIQRELNRSVWNGHVRLDARQENGNGFAKALLWEIGSAGRRTQDTFEQSIRDLQEMVSSSFLDSAALLSSLAVDILDRNLYERANDCRWWALNGTLIEHLSGGASDVAKVTEVLRHINSLYTVYHSIVLLDAERRIVAVSNPSQAGLIGSICNESWARDALQLRDSQSFCVSPFTPSPLYDGQHTLIFAAAVRQSQGRVVGAVGIVFDSTPQLAAMLKDALPNSGASIQSTGVFIDAERRVIAATRDYAPGETLDLPPQLLQTRERSRACVLQHRGIHYAAAACATSGYREYDRVPVTAIVLIPLGPAQPHSRRTIKPPALSAQRANATEPVVEIATFTCADQWIGVAREHVIEAIAAAGLRRLPGKPTWHAGVLMYQGNPLPVLDLSHITGQQSSSTLRDVIVIEPIRGASRIGLLVDDLTSIPEVALSSVLPLNDYSGRAGPRLIDRAVRPHRPDDPVLLILGVEQLMAQVRSEVGVMA